MTLEQLCNQYIFWDKIARLPQIARRQGGHPCQPFLIEFRLPAKTPRVHRSFDSFPSGSAVGGASSKTGRCGGGALIGGRFPPHPRSAPPPFCPPCPRTTRQGATGASWRRGRGDRSGGVRARVAPAPNPRDAATEEEGASPRT